MQPVLRLVPHHRLGPIDNRVGDLLAAVGRKAVQEERIRGGPRHQGVVDLEGGEEGAAALLLLLLTHAGPDVRGNQVGALGRLQRIAKHRAAVRGGSQQIRVRLVALRTGDMQLEVQEPGRLQIGLAHIVAVADPGHPTTADVPAVLVVGLKVGEHLARMQAVGQSVNHRHRRMGGEALHDLMTEGADHDRVHHAREDPGIVLDGLPAPELGVPWREEQGMAAKLHHAGLERDPGPGGRLLEDHGQGTVAQGPVVLAAPEHGLQLGAPSDQGAHLGGSQVQQGQQVPGGGRYGLHLGSGLPGSSEG